MLFYICKNILFNFNVEWQVDVFGVSQRDVKEVFHISVVLQKKIIPD